MDDLNLGDVVATGSGGDKERRERLFEVVIDVVKATRALEASKGEGIPGGSVPGTKMMTETELRNYLETLKKDKT